MPAIRKIEVTETASSTGFSWHERVSPPNSQAMGGTGANFSFFANATPAYWCNQFSLTPPALTSLNSSVINFTYIGLDTVGGAAARHFRLTVAEPIRFLNATQDGGVPSFALAVDYWDSLKDQSPLLFEFEHPIVGSTIMRVLEFRPLTEDSHDTAPENFREPDPLRCSDSIDTPFALSPFRVATPSNMEPLANATTETGLYPPPAAAGGGSSDLPTGLANATRRALSEIERVFNGTRRVMGEDECKADGPAMGIDIGIIGYHVTSINGGHFHEHEVSGSGTLIEPLSIGGSMTYNNCEQKATGCLSLELGLDFAGWSLLGVYYNLCNSGYINLAYYGGNAIGNFVTSQCPDYPPPPLPKLQLFGVCVGYDYGKAEAVLSHSRTFEVWPFRGSFNMEMRWSEHAFWIERVWVSLDWWAVGKWSNFADQEVIGKHYFWGSDSTVRDDRTQAVADQATPAYLGCFGDGYYGPDGQIKRRMIMLGESDIMTVDMCKNWAVNLGHRYFAIQWRRQCFVSSSRLASQGVTCNTQYRQPIIITTDTYRPQAATECTGVATTTWWGGSALCNLKCSGDGAECGGSWSNSLYDSGYIGCYKDSGDRALPWLLGSNGNMNPDICNSLARAQGLLLFSLQNGDQCWGGNDIDRATKYGEGVCWTQCRGKPWWNCGAGWTNSLYRTTR